MIEVSGRPPPVYFSMRNALVMGVSLTVDGVPLVFVLALGQLHDLAKTASAQGCLSILSQLVARGPLLAAGSRPELVSPVVATVMAL